ncbi:RidA family protein [Lachnospiraceae bacterium 62-35]
MNTKNVYEKMAELHIQLPRPIDDGACLSTIRPFGEKFLYISGIGPMKEEQAPALGKIPSQVSIEEGIEAARCCALNALASLHAYLGDLEKIKSFVKLIVFVSSERDFTSQHLVADGASRLLMDLFGDEIGKSARSAVGTSSLPLNYPVEVEMFVELK